MGDVYLYPSDAMIEKSDRINQLRIAINGLTLLKSASLLILISNIINIIVSITVILTVGFTVPLVGHVIREFEKIFTGFFWIIVLVGIVSLVIVLIAIYGRLIPACQKFAEYDRETFSTPATLIRRVWIYGVIFFIISMLSLILLIIIIGLTFLLIAAILIIVGEIGLIILMFRLADRFDEELFSDAGILFILLFFISFLNTIAWVLVYRASSRAISNLTASISQLSLTGESPPPPPVFN